MHHLFLIFIFPVLYRFRIYHHGRQRRPDIVRHIRDHPAVQRFEFFLFLELMQDRLPECVYALSQRCQLVAPLYSDLVLQIASLQDLDIFLELPDILYHPAHTRHHYEEKDRKAHVQLGYQRTIIELICVIPGKIDIECPICEHNLSCMSFIR